MSVLTHGLFPTPHPLFDLKHQASFLIFGCSVHSVAPQRESTTISLNLRPAAENFVHLLELGFMLFLAQWSHTHCLGVCH